MHQERGLRHRVAPAKTFAASRVTRLGTAAARTERLVLDGIRKHDVCGFLAQSRLVILQKADKKPSIERNWVSYSQNWVMLFQTSNWDSCGNKRTPPSDQEPGTASRPQTPHPTHVVLTHVCNPTSRRQKVPAAHPPHLGKYLFSNLSILPPRSWGDLQPPLPFSFSRDLIHQLPAQRRSRLNPES
jgi:hypothetical protein